MAASEFLEALSTIWEIDLTVTGRKSGRRSSRPIWFVHEQGKLYLLPVADSDTNWYKNVLVNPTLQEVQVDKSMTILEPRAGFEPATFACLGLCYQGGAFGIVAWFYQAEPPGRTKAAVEISLIN